MVVIKRLFRGDLMDCKECMIDYTEENKKTCMDCWYFYHSDSVTTDFDCDTRYKRNAETCPQFYPVEV